MPTRLIWLDGKLVGPEEFELGPADEGVIYGRGVFETTRTFHGQPWLWEEHCRRIVESARMIGLTLSEENLPSDEAVQDLIESHDGVDLVVRLTACASHRARGTRVWMTVRSLPDPQDSVRLSVSPFRAPTEDFLSSLKTCNYLRHRLALEFAQASEFDDALFVTSGGLVMESTQANIFARFRDRWLTPPLGAILPGTVRHLLLHDHSLDIAEEAFTLDELEEATEIVLTNSVRGVVAVREIDGLTYSPNRETEHLMQIVSSSQPTTD